MSHPWKKRYSFRLQEGDESLAAFLEQVPNTQTSKVIRDMLRFSYRHMHNDQKEQEQIQELIKEVRLLRESQEKAFTKIQKDISNLQAPVSPSKEDIKSSDPEISDDSVKATAQAMLESFGL